MRRPLLHILALLGIISCTKSGEIIDKPSNGSELQSGYLNIIASLPDMNLEGGIYKPQWNSEDEIIFAINDSIQEQNKLIIKEIKEDGVAHFVSQQKVDIAKGNCLQLLCPAGSYSGAPTAESGPVFNIKSGQNPIAESCDPECDILYSRLWASDVSLNAAFTRLTSIIKINIDGECDFKNISSVCMTIEQARLTGDFSITSSYGIKAEGNNSDKVSAVFSPARQLQSGKDRSIFLCIAPMTIGRGTDILFELQTDKGTVSKTVTTDESITFSSSVVKVFNLTFGPDTGQDPKPEPEPEPMGDYFISPNGNDRNPGTSPGSPFKTFDEALKYLTPGKVLMVMPGEYRAQAWNDIINLKKEHSGTEGNYVQIRAYDKSDKPVLYATGTGVWNAISINASYVIIDGLELKGNNPAINYDEAYDCARRHFYNDNKPDWGKTALYNTNGISIGGTGTKSSRPQHVIVRNCIVHDFPGGGISAMQADWVTIHNNIVYNNAWYCMYGCSGISILTPVNNDNNTTDYKNVITDNICYCNMTKVPWTGTKDFSLSDGNGIILDINNRPDSGGVAQDEGPYRGKTLVAGNISFYNGGSGIHTFKANNIDITNNTSYYNARKYPQNNYAEIWTNQSSNVNITNNIMYAKPGGYCNLDISNDTQIFSRNIYCGKTKIIGNGDIQADPMFVNLCTSLEDADFHLLKGSPAIGHGLHLSYTPMFDRDGVYRKHSALDAGAYQSKTE